MKLNFIKKKIKNYKDLTLSYKRQDGFTLIELMVSISVFMMIMLAAMSSLFISLDVSKKARALRYSMDNVNFAMDSISRTIRMGTGYTCASSIDIINDPLPSDCLSDSNISIIPQDKESNLDRIAYKLETVDGKGSVERCEYRASSGLFPCVGITSPNVDIKELKFVVSGSSKISGGDFNQAKVLIYMKGVVELKNGENVSFALQTLASQRNLD
ncbi:TPA: prepilin-type N-terminal cleavage/methylation domain-containing protein [Candidatus Nomurabacteria bacterium]|nr:MAG: hypothetical protein O210_OD1C00001G0456 [Parcubacteria bacterium RAAC4_OD1_1]HCY26316.1 prepilin-type N-terminal cleavage/methylation domain-containing protein [Candidatus Nomurabacteria bacterium]